MINVLCIQPERFLAYSVQIRNVKVKSTVLDMEICKAKSSTRVGGGLIMFIDGSIYALDL